MPNVFKFDRFILNIAPEDILIVAPSEDVVVVTLPEDSNSNDNITNTSSTGWFSSSRRKSSDTAEVTVYQVNVDTLYDDYVFEFDAEEIRDAFIDSIYDYINGTVTPSAVSAESSDTSKPVTTTTKSKSPAKKTTK